MSVAAGLALPAYMLFLYVLPIGAMPYIAAGIFAIACIAAAVGTYKMLGR